MAVTVRRHGVTGGGTQAGTARARAGPGDSDIRVVYGPPASPSLSHVQVMRISVLAPHWHASDSGSDRNERSRFRSVSAGDAEFGAALRLAALGEPESQ
jgi:hypothetical protein